MPNSLGPGELLQHYGTEAQKDHYLPRLARGLRSCFALTSPEAGSDAGAIPDTGVVCMGDWQGQQVLGMRLTSEQTLYHARTDCHRTWPSAFKLSDPDKLLGGEQELGITCALIPTSTPGRRNWSSSFPA